MFFSKKHFGVLSNFLAKKAGGFLKACGGGGSGQSKEFLRPSVQLQYNFNANVSHHMILRRCVRVQSTVKEIEHDSPVLVDLDAFDVAMNSHIARALRPIFNVFSGFPIPQLLQFQKFKSAKFPTTQMRTIVLSLCDCLATAVTPDAHHLRELRDLRVGS